MNSLELEVDLIRVTIHMNYPVKLCQELIERGGMQLIQWRNKSVTIFSNTKLREILEFLVYFPSTPVN